MILPPTDMPKIPSRQPFWLAVSALVAGIEGKSGAPTHTGGGPPRPGGGPTPTRPAAPPGMLSERSVLLEELIELVFDAAAIERLGTSRQRPCGRFLRGQLVVR